MYVSAMQFQLRLYIYMLLLSAIGFLINGLAAQTIACNINCTAQTDIHSYLDILESTPIDSTNRVQTISNCIETCLFRVPINEQSFQDILDLTHILTKNNQQPRADSLLNRAINLVNSDNSENWKTRLFLQKSLFLNYEGKLQEALISIDSALACFQNNNIELEAELMINEGRLYYDLGNYPKAMQVYMKAKEKFESNHIRNEDYGTLLHFIGSVFKRQGDDAQSELYYDQMLTFAREINNPTLEAEALYLLADVYAYTRRYELEHEYLNRALAIYRSQNDWVSVALVLMNMAHGEIYEDKYEDAQSKIYEALRLCRENGSNEFDFTLYRYLGKIESRQGNYNQALIYFDTAMTKVGLREDKRALNLEYLYHDLAVTHYDRGAYRSGYEYLERYMHVKDSLFNKETQSTILDLEEKYQNEKKQAQIAALNKDKKIAEAEIERQSIWNKAIAIGLLLTSILAITIFMSRKRIHQKNKIISEKIVEVEYKNKEILDSITYAKRIQLAILPPQKVVKQYLKESFILYKPKDVVAGDFYWMETGIDSPVSQVGEELVFFAAADCTGHGVPGAMVSVICNNGLNRSVREMGLTNADQILNNTRSLVIQEFEKSVDDVKDGMDISLCVLNTSKHTLNWAGANNPLWIVTQNKDRFIQDNPAYRNHHLLVHQNWDLFEIKGDKQPIGSYENSKPFSGHNLQLRKTDTIYISTDGFPDQFGGPNGKKFKSRRFKETLVQLVSKPMDEQREFLNATFESWQGSLEQIDDVCVIGVRV